MNDNTNLFTHMHTDQNAWKHSLIGFIVFLITITTMLQFTSFEYSLLCSLTSPYTAGFVIEVWQRFRGGTNTYRESVMDILTTGLFFLYPVAIASKK